MSSSPSPGDRGNTSLHGDTSCYSRKENTSAPSSLSETSPSAQCLALTQDRLLLYLKCLNITPGKEQLSLSLEALARLNTGHGDHDLTPAAIHSLRNLLSTEALARENSRYGKLYSMGFFTKNLDGLESAPPLNRGHMIPLKFEQLPEWLSSKSALSNLVTQLRPLLIPLFILLNILLLIGLFFWL